MNKDLYLIRIKTVTGLTLYIDDCDVVWSEGTFGDIDDKDAGPVYFDDLEEARDFAAIYGGDIVRCMFTMEKVI